MAPPAKSPSAFAPAAGASVGSKAGAAGGTLPPPTAGGGAGGGRSGGGGGGGRIFFAATLTATVGTLGFGVYQLKSDAGFRAEMHSRYPAVVDAVLKLWPLVGGGSGAGDRSPSAADAAAPRASEKPMGASVGTAAHKEASAGSVEVRFSKDEVAAFEAQVASVETEALKRTVSQLRADLVRTGVITEEGQDLADLKAAVAAARSRLERAGVLTCCGKDVVPVTRQSGAAAAKPSAAAGAVPASSVPRPAAAPSAAVPSDQSSSPSGGAARGGKVTLESEMTALQASVDSLMRDALGRSAEEIAAREVR
jgi:hypothetical protein